MPFPVPTPVTNGVSLRESSGDTLVFSVITRRFPRVQLRVEVPLDMVSSVFPDTQPIDKTLTLVETTPRYRSATIGLLIRTSCFLPRLANRSVADVPGDTNTCSVTIAEGASIPTIQLTGVRTAFVALTVTTSPGTVLPRPPFGNGSRQLSCHPPYITVTFSTPPNRARVVPIVEGLVIFVLPETQSEEVTTDVEPV